MHIGDLLIGDAILMRQGASSKRQALHIVAEAASELFGLSETTIFDALLEREALGSTGLGSGVAVPHARLAGLDRVKAVFVKLESPVPYDAVDDRPVDLMFGLFAPPTDGAEHLRALAAVSRTMRSPDFRQRLRQANTIDAISALFVQQSPAATAA
ncbi:PTS sugar transporter subunit IIA [Brevundimonas variabilis]|uniref:PTS system nitrogen regulatory IIA component n=1 Tax=Brevundimonas variabilis TaxID=74312 RepID=A0A7W9FEP7_9CAUL|nr:PTS sugar transporter subunit IIA [Brevundimonas variabilis]MBB5746681.1 PTS system nitrogen regulatory IIA component [Brevundimonas variabilis]